MPTLTRKQVRAFDRLAIEAYGVPGVVLMENAGRNAAEVVLDVLVDELGVAPHAGRVAVLCGGGNNGGDGYVIARHLHVWGLHVTLWAAVDPDGLKGDAAVHANIARRLKLDLQPLTEPGHLDAAAGAWRGAHVVVDALLGTGFEGEVRPHLAAVIGRLNATRGPVVVAVDVPSGLDCDTGAPANATVRAGVTVTFVDRKAGFDAPAAAPHLGRVVVADVGVPQELVARVRPLDEGA